VLQQAVHTAAIIFKIPDCQTPTIPKITKIYERTLKQPRAALA